MLSRLIFFLVIAFWVNTHNTQASDRSVPLTEIPIFENSSFARSTAIVAIGIVALVLLWKIGKIIKQCIGYNQLSKELQSLLQEWQDGSDNAVGFFLRWINTVEVLSAEEKEVLQNKKNNLMVIRLHLEHPKPSSFYWDNSDPRSCENIKFEYKKKIFHGFLIHQSRSEGCFLVVCKKNTTLSPGFEYSTQSWNLNTTQEFIQDLLSTANT